MKTVIAAAAATLVFAFTAHAGEVVSTPRADRHLATTCPVSSHWLSRVSYTHGAETKCAQFLATGNVLQTRRWNHT